MLVTKSTVTGVDIPIQRFQTLLYNQLKALWLVPDDVKFNLYGRAYRNQDEKKAYTAEVFTGVRNEYDEVYFDDTLWASGFFGLGENIQVDNANVTANVYLIMCVDLSKIKSGTMLRKDEEAHVDVEKIAFKKYYGFNLTGIITGIDNVFKEYSGYKKDTGMRYRDMHPFHCFRLNFKLTYNIYDCN